MGSSGLARSTSRRANSRPEVFSSSWCRIRTWFTRILGCSFKNTCSSFYSVQERQDSGVLTWRFSVFKSFLIKVPLSKRELAVFCFERVTPLTGGLAGFGSGVWSGLPQDQELKRQYNLSLHTLHPTGRLTGGLQDQGLRFLDSVTARPSHFVIRTVSSL